ncbi:DUF2752 domain-containing protein [Winogradskyella sp.]|uniref:DUF2752 domain-containing protein n=1 Tax=Winogradskyella sp. TaxID=1883156 RepID=UPI0026325E16|nr:DUF2752 domain-containing protein [Winogradskyella sp.]
MYLPAEGIEEYMLPCLIKKTIGVDCLGCGMQRSIVLILKGEFVAAFYMYPAIYPVIFLFVFLIFDNYFKVKHSERIKFGLAALTLITIVTNYILKF